MEQKPWYKSKIVVISLVAITTLVSNHLTGFITGVATPEQIQAVAALDPSVGELIEKVKSGQNWFTSAGTVVFGFVAVIRVWFTKKKLVF